MPYLQSREICGRKQTYNFVDIYAIPSNKFAYVIFGRIPALSLCPSHVKTIRFQVCSPLPAPFTQYKFSTPPSSKGVFVMIFRLAGHREPKTKQKEETKKQIALIPSIILVSASVLAACASSTAATASVDATTALTREHDA